MNSRILKKLCKRARPLLLKFGLPESGFFTTGVNDEAAWTFHPALFDDKHLCTWTGKEHGYIEPFHGTIGWGQMCGYYEPEWEDQPAYEMLVNAYLNQFIDVERFDDPDYTPNFPKKVFPSMVFAWAESLPDGWNIFAERVLEP